MVDKFGLGGVALIGFAVVVLIAAKVLVFGR